MPTSHESSPVTARTSPWGTWRTLLLAAAIFVAVLVNNAGPVFRAPHYERGDLAANSLQIIRAKHFGETLGNYSRFGFHHPGPAFFYVYAAGETLFHDALRLVPTPLNAQWIALYALSALFFSATLGVIARRLESASRKWFLALALLFAAWHFAAVGKVYGADGLFCIWPPCVLLFPFLCLLVAGASVATGNGKDLPLLTLAACFLVHGHVAMPLFVVPVTLLVYGSFLLRLRRARSGEKTWPWKAFPRQHWVAGAIIVLFLVPIVIDLFASNPSNLRVILDHLQHSYGEKKGLVRSSLYFLHFGASSVSELEHHPGLETFDLPGTLGFFRTHWRPYVLWLAVVVIPLVLPSTRLIGTELRIFLNRIYAVLACAVLLTLCWGHIQEGPMYYFNAYFSFAIYYGLLLIFAVTLAEWIARRVSVRSGLASVTRDWLRPIERAALVAVAIWVVIVFRHEARRFRFLGDDADQQHLFATSIERALKIDSIQPKIVNFEGQTWAEALGVGLYLERSGASWYVADYAPSIPVMFGRDRAIPDKEIAARLPKASIWRIVSPAAAQVLASEQGLSVMPLAKEVALVVRPSPNAE